MRKITKFPKVGQRIIHEEPHLDKITEGVVINLLSAQFTYKSDDDRINYCFYTGLWKDAEGG